MEELVFYLLRMEFISGVKIRDLYDMVLYILLVEYCYGSGITFTHKHTHA